MKERFNKKHRFLRKLILWKNKSSDSTMGITKVVACFVVALLVVGREVSADCLSDCFTDCIGYEQTICTLKCYYKCKWVEKKEVEALVEKLTPEQKAMLHEIEKGEANKEPESNTSRKLKAAMKF